MSLAGGRKYCSPPGHPSPQVLSATLWSQPVTSPDRATRRRQPQSHSQAQIQLHICKQAIPLSRLHRKERASPTSQERRFGFEEPTRAEHPLGKGSCHQGSHARRVGPTWEASGGQRRSAAPIVCEKDQHWLLALMVAPARCELQWWGVVRAPHRALDCHQQTLVAAFIFGPFANLENQTSVTMDRDRHCTGVPTGRSQASRRTSCTMAP